MNSFFNSLPENQQAFLLGFPKIIISSLLTYFITKYSLVKPRQYSIKEKQFELVYLPLYLVMQQYLSCQPQDIPSFFKKANKIIHKNYPLVYPKTLKLMKHLETDLATSKVNGYIIIMLQQQITHDYDSLKRVLGYPTNSFSSFFTRMNIIDIVMHTIKLILVFAIIYSVSTFFVYVVNGNIFEAITIIIFAPFAAFLLYIFQYGTRY